MSTLAQLQPGVVFAGDFRVVRPLKEGGMGAVYVAEQLSTSKQRALKVMLPELVADASLRKRFETEARVGARIRSDHVVEVIASGVDAESGMPWLVMELLEGEDLEGHTRGKGPLPPAEVRAIVEQLCHALGEAHREGIVHRDLKPENIFLATPRRAGVTFMVKVLDFGIARVAAEARTTSSATNAILGTPLWMPPEQALPGVVVTPAADVWALGLIVYRLLTGRYFWKTPYAAAPSLMMLMNEAFMLPMPTPGRRAEEDGVGALVPAGFDAWFERCTARDPGARFANATEAFEALDRVLAPQAAPVSAQVGSGGDAHAGSGGGVHAGSGGDVHAGSGGGVHAGSAAPVVSVSVTPAISVAHASSASGAPAGSNPAAPVVSVSVTPAISVAPAAGSGAAPVTFTMDDPSVAIAVTQRAVQAQIAAPPDPGVPPSAPGAHGSPPRSRAAVVISVLVTVTVAFGAFGLFARTRLLGDRSAGDVTVGPVTATAEPPITPQPPALAASAAPQDTAPAIASAAPPATTLATAATTPQPAGTANARPGPTATAKPAAPVLPKPIAPLEPLPKPTTLTPKPKAPRPK